MSMISKYPEQDSGSMFNGSMIDYLDAILYGGKCVGYQEFDVDDNPAVSLTVPVGAKACVIVVEAGGSPANANRVARFREDGTAPTALIGMPIGDNGSVEVKGTTNMTNFKIIATEVLTHKVRVQYYGAG